MGRSDEITKFATLSKITVGRKVDPSDRHKPHYEMASSYYWCLLRTGAARTSFKWTAHTGESTCYWAPGEFVESSLVLDHKEHGSHAARFRSPGVNQGARPTHVDRVVAQSRTQEEW